MTALGTLRSPAVALLTLLALVPNLALAQKLSFGPTVGVAISTWRGADARPTPAFHAGFVGGGFVTIGIYKHFALEAQLLYARKGMELTTTTCSFPNTCQPFTVSYTQDVIEIPFLFTLAGPTRFAPTIFAGPAVAFQTSCTFRSSGPLSVAPCDTIFSGRNPVPAMRHTDAIMAFGGGFHIGPLAILARYDLGLTKFLHRQTTSFDEKTRAWLMSVGYRLSLGRR